MFYRGMPDVYEYNYHDYANNIGQEVWQVFWYEGEFHLCNKNWSNENGKNIPSRMCNYFDTTDEVLKAMLEIAPYRDWKRIEL